MSFLDNFRSYLGASSGASSSHSYRQIPDDTSTPKKRDDLMKDTINEIRRTLDYSARQAHFDSGDPDHYSRAPETLQQIANLLGNYNNRLDGETQQHIRNLSNRLDLNVTTTREAITMKIRHMLQDPNIVETEVQIQQDHAQRISRLFQEHRAALSGQRQGDSSKTHNVNAPIVSPTDSSLSQSVSQVTLDPYATLHLMDPFDTSRKDPQGVQAQTGLPSDKTVTEQTAQPIPSSSTTPSPKMRQASTEPGSILEAREPATTSTTLPEPVLSLLRDTLLQPDHSHTEAAPKKLNDVRPTPNHAPAARLGDDSMAAPAKQTPPETKRVLVPGW